MKLFKRILSAVVSLGILFSSALQLRIFAVGDEETSQGDVSSSEKRLSLDDIFGDFEEEAKNKDRDEKERLGIVMEPKYYREDYNKEYEKSDDLSRIVRGTFDASKYFPNGIFAAGPWRVDALKKAASKLKFRLFHRELLKRNWGDICNGTTDNEEFECIAEECHQEWNRLYNTPERINTYEDAFKKALWVMTDWCGCREHDPFCNRRVEVLFDAKNKIYVVNETVDTRFYMRHTGGYTTVILNDQGYVIAIDGTFMQ
ncbi:MAG: hypothetical protein Q4D57_03940 [Clostridia bacterium]|nr:hypothetical protein [Clostridia bacterium]